MFSIRGRQDPETILADSASDGHQGNTPEPWPQAHSIALTMSSTTFFASPNTIIVLSV